jgi:membrane-bound lytic murein transglycosylase B
MSAKKNLLATLVLSALLATVTPVFALDKSPPLEAFIAQMVKKHHFNAAKLTVLFKSARLKKDILKIVVNPIEGAVIPTPWYKYRRIFLTEQRIDGGVQFWLNHKQVLSDVEQKYGVPAQIIVAIIGAETFYGRDTGRYRLIDSLSTLGFGYPKRSQFFLTELENFLLLSREEKQDPLTLLGSYTGAMGLAQFMPSSFRSYVVDFDGDHRRDIWHNPNDAIASVANYLLKYGWRAGADIAQPVTAVGNKYQTVLKEGLALDTTLAQLQNLQVRPAKKLPLNTAVKLFSFAQENGQELWIGLHNFYVITRYNHSSLYAMAVYQLSQAILAKKEATL